MARNMIPRWFSPVQPPTRRQPEQASPCHGGRLSSVPNIWRNRMDCALKTRRAGGREGGGVRLSSPCYDTRHFFIRPTHSETWYERFGRPPSSHPCLPRQQTHLGKGQSNFHGKIRPTLGVTNYTTASGAPLSTGKSYPQFNEETTSTTPSARLETRTQP